MKIHSDIEDDKKYMYKLWFDFTIQDTGNIITTQKVDINCTEVYDERGYIHRDKVIKLFKALFKDQVSKV